MGGPEVDVGGLDGRLQEVLEQGSKGAYSRKKMALESDFSAFRQNITQGVGLVGATPKDICRYLIWKDKGGKTAVHELECGAIGDRMAECACPRRLGAGTVGTLVGQLRGLFTDMGRSRPWEEGSEFGNPANSLLVKKYVKAIREEQSRAHVQPKQATPLFIHKLEAICGYIDRQLERGDLTKKLRLIYLRDQAFWKLQFFAGDRASDLGKMLTQEIRRLPSGALHIRHTWGKTFRMDKPNSFEIHPCPRVALCPVAGLEKYVMGARKLAVDLRVGFLFRSVTRDGQMGDKPLGYGAVYERLKFYLNVLSIDEGETPHSVRGGCAITMAGEAKKGLGGLMGHVGWQSVECARYYTRDGEQGTSVSQKLSAAVAGYQAYDVAHSFWATSGEQTLPKAFQ